MNLLKTVQINELMIDLPDIKEIDFASDVIINDDLFLCALGFEQRSLNIPEKLVTSQYKCRTALYLEYETNVQDNANNSTRLISALETISDSLESPMRLQESDFIEQFNRYISALSEGRECPPQISIDISTFSSPLLLMTLSIIFEYNISLRILYSEAGEYYPTQLEYEQKKDLYKSNEDEGISHGVSKVITLPTNSGENLDNLPEMVVAFATFKPERTRKVISDIALSEKDMFWIIGKPHLEINYWRASALFEINGLSGEVSQNVAELSTFEYKDTIGLMESIYKSYEDTHHITISAMGSKLQNLGLAVWSYIRKDVTLCLAVPASYDSKRFSTGVYKTWVIDFGPIQRIVALLNSVDTIVRY